MSTPRSLLYVPQHALKLRVRIFQSQTWLLPTTAVRCFATVQTGTKNLPIVWFNGSIPLQKPPDAALGPRRPQDERTVKLGRTLRILQSRLPTLLQSPLPSEILSPQISLHLFPSTHPHLPTVSGRVAYIAALWTSPIAWGRVPIVGNVKLEILSERMVRNNPRLLTPSPSPSSSSSGGGHGIGYRSEQLVVRWRTVGKKRGRIGPGEPADKTTESSRSGGKIEEDDKEFTGLFIFEFDEEGRILSHTIEHVQEGGNWEKGVGARVVGLTDWLLGGLKGKGEGEGRGTPCPAFWHVGRQQRRKANLLNCHWK